MRRGLDHLVICVTDLDDAAKRYQDMGFTLTPRAHHAWGTDNRLVQLQGNFIELLTVARPELIEPTPPGGFSFGGFNQDFLAKHDGMSMLVFESTEASRDQAEFEDRNIGGLEPFHFERQATLPDGAAVTVAFSLAFSRSQALPKAPFFCCQQHAPEFFWKPEFQRHTNGAQVVDEVLMVASDLEAAADYFEKLTEPEAVTRSVGEMVVATPRGSIRVLAPDAAAQVPGAGGIARDVTRQFLGYSIRVADLSELRSLLQRQQVPFDEESASLWVGPDYALGVVIQFHE